MNKKYISVFIFVLIINLFYYGKYLFLNFNTIDIFPILETHRIKNFKSIFSGFTTKYTGSYTPRKFYRPITILTFQINYLISKLHPFIYFLINFIIHCLNVLLLFFILERIFKISNIFISISVITFFSIFHQHLETVPYLFTRNDLLATLFMLGSIYTFYRFRETQTINNENKKKYLYYSIVFYTLGILSKETGALTMCYLITTDIIFFNDKLLKKIYHTAIVIMPYFIITVIFFLVKYRVSGSAFGSYDDSPLFFSYYILKKYLYTAIIGYPYYKDLFVKICFNYKLPVMIYLIFCFIYVIIFTVKQNKNYVSVMLFGLFCFGISAVFYSFFKFFYSWYLYSSSIFFSITAVLFIIISVKKVYTGFTLKKVIGPLNSVRERDSITAKDGSIKSTYNLSHFQKSKFFSNGVNIVILFPLIVIFYLFTAHFIRESSTIVNDKGLGTASVISSDIENKLNDKLKKITGNADIYLINFPYYICIEKEKKFFADSNELFKSYSLKSYVKLKFPDKKINIKVLNLAVLTDNPENINIKYNWSTEQKKISLFFEKGGFFCGPSGFEKKLYKGIDYRNFTRTYPVKRIIGIPDKKGNRKIYMFIYDYKKKSIIEL